MKRAEEIWATARAADDEHPYLRAAGLRAHGARVYAKPGVEAGFLVVPVLDADGQLCGLQYFDGPNDAGRFFPAELELRGEHFIIGDPKTNGSLSVLQDYWAAARHHEATGQAVAVAFTAANVEAAVRVLAAKYPAAQADENAEASPPERAAVAAPESPTVRDPVASPVTTPVATVAAGRPTSEFPDPPVPTWGDLRNFPRVWFDRRRLFASHFHATASANPAAYLAGFILWLKSLDQVPAGSLPDDDVALCHLAELGGDLDRWRAVKPLALHGWRKHSDGRLYHAVVAETVFDALKAKDQTSKARMTKLRNRVKETNEPLERARIEADIEKIKQQRHDLARLLSVTSNVTLTPSPSPSDVDVAVDSPARAVTADCPHDQVIALYHELLPTCPRVRVWSDSRKGHLRSRWRQMAKANGTGRGYATIEDGLAWWRKFFGHVAKSPFLTGQIAGRDGKPPFIASLAWLVKEENFAKVIEGNYDAGA